jgi:hypothetical protein
MIDRRRHVDMVRIVVEGEDTHGYTCTGSRVVRIIATSLSIRQLIPHHNTRRADVTVNVNVYLSLPAHYPQCLHLRHHPIKLLYMSHGGDVVPK